MLKDVLDRIEERLTKLGLSATAASEQAGLSKDAIRNIRRAVKTGSQRTGVSTRTIEALAPVLDTSVGWLLEGREDSKAGLRLESAVEDLPGLPVIGTVEAGAWREAVAVADADEFYHFQPSPSFPVDKQFLMRVSGPSCNRVVRDGGRVLVVSYEAVPGGLDNLVARAEPPLVIFERERAGAYEYTMKALKLVSGKIELHPVSDHPAHQSKVVLDENGDTNHVRVAYVVLEVINPVF